MPTRCNHPGLLEQVEKIVTNNLDPRFTRELERLLTEHRATRNRAPTAPTAPTAATRAKTAKPGAWDEVINRMGGSAA